MPDPTSGPDKDPPASGKEKDHHIASLHTHNEPRHKLYNKAKDRILNIENKLYKLKYTVK